MNKRRNFLKTMLTGRMSPLGAIALFAVWAPPAVQSAGADKAPPPAQLAKAVSESAVNTITLTAEAEQRLGIRLATAEKKAVVRKRLFSGEIIPALPMDKRASGKQSAQLVVYQLAPGELLRIAESQADAEGKIAAAQAQLDGGLVSLKRAEQLLRTETGSQRALDDARTQVAVAEATLKAAREQRDLLGPAVLPDGKAETVWIRVPVYAGDVEEIERSGEAEVGGFSGRLNPKSVSAKLVSAQPSSRSSSVSVDLFYETSNGNGALTLGQKVGVTLPLKRHESGLTIPRQSVVIDIYGGSWVYKKSGEHTYVRQRIAVSHLSGADAVLSAGLQAGDSVVTDGAAELFGTEFGSGK